MLTRRAAWVALVLAVALLGACAKKPDMSKTLSLAAEDEYGIVFGHVAPLANVQEGWVEFDREGGASLKSGLDANGFFLLKVKAGALKMTRFGRKLEDKQQEIVNLESYYTFTVEPSQVTYVGLVIVSPVDYKVYVTDDFFRDRKWFDKVAEGKLTAISKFPNQFYYAQMERYSTVPPPQPVIQSGRVSIPATRFLMGDIWPGKGVRGPGAREGDLSQIPPHEVSVSAFAIDQFPVSRAAFGRAGAAAVAEVTWQDAQDFCEQRGGRLPTEAEWELAARGPRWGDRYYGGAPSVTARRPVGNGQPPATDNPGAWTTSPWGASFHGEELAEWTVDWYSAISFRLANPQDPGGAANGAAKVVRAGPYRFAVPPDQRLEGVGFRCVYATAAPRTFVAPADSGPAPSFKPGTEPKTKKHSPIRELRLVARAEINLYAGPSVKAAVVTRVPAGTALTFVGMSDEFYLVRLDNGDEGFVRMDLVEQAPGVK